MNEKQESAPIRATEPEVEQIIEQPDEKNIE